MIRGGILRGPAPLSHPNTPPPSAFPRKNSHSTPPPAAFPRKNSPSTPENADLGPFFVRWANFFALAPTPGQAGRTFSRTGHGHVPSLKPMTPLQPLMQASMKPPAPLLAPKQRPLKPATPLQPKNARKTASFRPQRRWRFQLGLGQHPQRRCRFQLTPLTGPQRRRRFHARDFQCPRAAAGPGCGTRGRRRGLPGRPVGGRRYKRRQTNTIHIASRGPLLQTSSI